MHILGIVIKNALLALLGNEQKYGYQLKNDFEAATGTAWVLNIGQVYTTLQRLERDGAIVALGQDDDGRSLYELSATGREILSEWLSSAVIRSVSTRDEVTMKVLVASATGVIDPATPISIQRQTAMRVLQEATLARNVAESLADQLHLERLIVLTNAEIRWLDIAEDRLAEAAKARLSNNSSTQEVVDNNNTSITNLGSNS